MTTPGIYALRRAVLETERRTLHYRSRAVVNQLVKRSFVLEPGEETTVRVGPPLVPTTFTVPVVATLLLDSDPSYVYRRVESTLTAPASTVTVPEPTPAAPKSTQTAPGAKR